METFESCKLNTAGRRKEAFRPWKSIPDGDPGYPWRSEKNEKGEIVYSVPLECPNDIPMDNSDGAGKYTYTWLRLFGGKRLRVYWIQTDNREWAYEQKRWIDAEAKRNERRRKHEVPIADILGDGIDDGNHKTEWRLLDDVGDPTGEDPDVGDAEKQKVGANPEKDEAGDRAADNVKPTARKVRFVPFRFPQTEPQALARIELEKIRQYIVDRQPRLWRAFYLKEWCGMDVKEIAAELKVDPSRVYQMVTGVHRLAGQYLKETR